MRFPIALVLIALASVSLLPSASAHGRVCLQADGTFLDRGGHGKPGPTGATGDCPDGDLVEFVIGWQEEPPFAGPVNGLDLGLRLPVDSAPITNVTTLRAEYRFGGESIEVGTAPQFGRPGWYGESIAPTRPGEYELHVWGNLTHNGTSHAVDFTTHPAEVAPMSDIEFPAREAAPDTSALEARVAALEQQVRALQTKGNGTMNNGVTVTPQPGPGQTNTPGLEPLAFIAVLGVAAWAARRRGQP